MSKRHTEVDKWKQEWFMNLQIDEKLVYIYLHEACDLAGFFELNPRYNSFVLNIAPERYLDIVRSFAHLYILSPCGTYGWLKNYIKDQGNFPLKHTNPAHRGVARCVESKFHHFQEGAVLRLLEVTVEDLRILCEKIPRGEGASKELTRSISKSKCISNGNSKGNSNSNESILLKENIYIDVETTPVDNSDNELFRQLKEYSNKKGSK